MVPPIWWLTVCSRPFPWSQTLSPPLALGVFHTLSPTSLAFPPLRNLQAFNSLILGNAPLFQAETILSAPEIILHPNATEIDKMCVHCTRNCVEITKVTRRSPGNSSPSACQLLIG